MLTDAEIEFRNRANELLDREIGIPEEQYNALRKEAVDQGYLDVVEHMDGNVDATDGFFYFPWAEYRLPVPTYIWTSIQVGTFRFGFFDNERDAVTFANGGFVQRSQIFGECWPYPLPD